MASKFRSNGSDLSAASDDSQPTGKPPLPPPPRVTFARRTPSGRYVSYSRDDDLDSELSSADFLNYTVHMPPTPDNQTDNDGGAAAAVSRRVEEQYVSSSLFTGGFNSTTRAHLMDRVIDGEKRKSSSSCAINGCDGTAVDGTLLPCECEFTICRDCYVDALKTGEGVCPGCKDRYKTTDLDEAMENLRPSIPPPQLPPPPPPLTSMVKSTLHNNKSTSFLMRSQTGGDWDQGGSLFETNAIYGYGNAIWPKNEDDEYSHLESSTEFLNKPWRPLTRKLKIPAAIISPYRLLIFVRMAVLALFLVWRVRHPNRDAMWLWGLSVVCEIWFAFSWMLDQLPKLCPINRSTDLTILREKFETPSPTNPTAKSDLPGIDIFVSTADPDKEPPLVTANTILSILAADYPVEKLACYVSDDGGALLTFEAMAEAARFANLWVPFCRKHSIEPRNPESYFGSKKDPYKNKVLVDFVKDRRRVKREYDEFKVRINGLPDSIRRRSDSYHAREELTTMKEQRMSKEDETKKATWMADGNHWPGTWLSPSTDHTKGDHAGIIQVMLKPPNNDPIFGNDEEHKVIIDFTSVDVRLPMLVYVSREKRPTYDHNKKAGAMNALVRASAIMSNGPFILNLDCDHYIYNSQAMREGMCFMMDRGGDRICFVQFPQRFEGIDPSDRYANRNTVFFDGNMRALDGLQGPVYVGTGCLFRRIALYGFDPPRSKTHSDSFFLKRIEKNRELRNEEFGKSNLLLDSIPAAEFAGRPLADHPSVKNGRPPGALTGPRASLFASTLAEAISVVSSFYEEGTEWGGRVGWIYGSVTEDVVTGYRMHNRGWRSVYCVTRRDAFRGTAPINLTDRLHQVLRWATGSVEIFFSKNNALLASSRMKVLQRVAYLNVGIYPFTSIFLIVYCFLPALSLFSGQFIVQSLDVTFLSYLLVITTTLCALALLEVKWSGVELEEWWRNEQFWLIGGTSAHLAAVFQGLLKTFAGVEISFTLTSKSAGDEDEEDAFAELYLVKWSSLMIPPIVIMMVNLVAIAVGVSRTVYSVIPQWSRLLGGVFFSFWVLAHLYPFAKGLMGRRGRTPTIVYVWSGLIAIIISLLWIAVNPPAGNNPNSFQLP